MRCEVWAGLGSKPNSILLSRIEYPLFGRSGLALRRRTVFGFSRAFNQLIPSPSALFPTRLAKPPSRTQTARGQRERSSFQNDSPTFFRSARVTVRDHVAGRHAAHRSSVLYVRYNAIRVSRATADNQSSDL